MAPMIEAFPPWKLESRVNLTPQGKLLRKGERIELEKCKLRELVQFDCELRGPVGNPRSVVVCAPIVRMFRR